MYFCQIEPMFSYRGKGFHSLRELNRIRINNIKWYLFITLIYMNCENNNNNDNKTMRRYLHCFRFLLTMQ